MTTYRKGQWIRFYPKENSSMVQSFCMWNWVSKWQGVRGEPKKKKTWNYLLEGGPLVAQPSPTRCLGTHLCQCSSWWCCERLCLACEFVLKTLLTICPFLDGWFMSTPGHTALSVQQFLTINSTTPRVPRPPHSPDLTPSDLLGCLFPWMKKVLKGKHFANVSEVK